MTVLENLQLGATTNQMAYFDEDVAKVFDLFLGSMNVKTNVEVRSQGVNSKCWLLEER